jgi:hypothetical protein
MQIEKLSEAVETVALRDDIISLLVRQPFSFLADFLSGHVKRAGSMPGLCRDLMRQPRFLQYRSSGLFHSSVIP